MDTNELLGTVIVAGVAMKMMDNDHEHHHRHKKGKKGQKQKGLLF
jgi:hypothetical protein